MARFTIKLVGERFHGNEPHCVVCGTRRTLNGKVCVNLCHWILEGWVAWNAASGEVKFTDNRALPLAALHKWNAKLQRVEAPSFPKLVAAARELGWHGNTASPSQPTFFTPRAN